MGMGWKENGFAVWSLLRQTEGGISLDWVAEPQKRL
jgi:hypothetical protein